MILQALVNYYDRLVEKGELEPPGWQPVKVSYGLDLNADGVPVRLIPLRLPVPRGKKEVLAPQVLNVPAQVKRAVGIEANFLCDNSSYLLGIDAKGKPERARKCFAVCREMHLLMLEGVDSLAARAVAAFFQTWKPETAWDWSALNEHLEDAISGGNIVFMVNGHYAHVDAAIREAWNRNYMNASEGEIMCCLVTGERGPIARLHPSIRGVAGGQPSGTSLVSFNAPAYESFGRDGGQGSNAPVSQRAAFAYGAALNRLISEQDHRMRLGDSTVVFWAEDAEKAYADFFTSMLGNGNVLKQSDLQNAMQNLAEGKPVIWGDIPLRPENRFHILGLAPNAARLSVRFYLQDSFGVFAERLQAHFKRMEIVRPAYDQRPALSIWEMLNETVNQKSRDKSPSPQLAGELMRAILMGTPYPATLLSQTELRIRAEREITRGRAAILKVYLLRNGCTKGSYSDYEEALTVELNEATNYPAYLLGRLFSVLEGLQQAANAGINTTIRDRYFNSACATPAVVFPQLIKLAQAHLKKLNAGGRKHFEIQIAEIAGRMNQAYPVRLNLYDQGVFQLGYYHQTQKRFQKKEEKNNG